VEGTPLSEKVLSRAEEAADRKDYQFAEQLCDELLALEPMNTGALRLKAFALAMRQDLTSAIDVSNSLIEADSKKSEPSDYFDRGRWLLETGRFNEAIADFSKVIELCEQYEDNYYLDAALLYRAIGHVSNSQGSQAIADLTGVDQDSSAFALGKVYTKDSILAELRDTLY
jgi:tetratricopeptide (TPR) repeat protein